MKKICKLSRCFIKAPLDPFVQKTEQAIGIEPRFIALGSIRSVLRHHHLIKSVINAGLELLERCKTERRPGTNYAIVYGYNTEALNLVREACAQIMDRPPIAEYQVGCVISINTGPNMVGILYRT